MPNGCCLFLFLLYAVVAHVTLYELMFCLYIHVEYFPLIFLLAIKLPSEGEVLITPHFNAWRE